MILVLSRRRAASLTRPQPDLYELPHRTRSARRASGARRRVLRRADRARRRELPDQRPARAAPTSSPRPFSSRRRPPKRTPTLGRLDPADRRRHPRRGRRNSGGPLRDQFVVDVYQAGAGTSHNMNANEVLANRAGEILGEPRGTYTRVHPNDHVNMGQSTNDVFPTATRLALLLGAGPLVDAARALADSLARKARRVRRRAQDRPDASAGRGADHARPGVQRLRRVHRPRRRRCRAGVASSCAELNIGATAVGTGLNAGDDFRRLVVEQPRARHRAAADAGAQSVSRDAEHGRRARVLRRDAAAGGRARQGRQRPAAAQHGTARRARRRSRCRPCSPDRRSCRAR